MKKFICACLAFSLLSMCMGCGSDENIPRPSRYNAGYPIYMLGIEIDGQDGDFVGGYNSYFDKDRTPQVELVVNEKYSICLGRPRSYLDMNLDSYWTKQEWLDGHKDGFDSEKDGAYVSSAIFESKWEEVSFEYDENIMRIETETKTYLDVRPDGYSKEVSWDDYKIVGLCEGASSFAVTLYEVDPYSPAKEKELIYTYNLTLVFTSGESEE